MARLPDRAAYLPHRNGLPTVLCRMSNKFCRLDSKGVERIAALGFDYFSVTELSKKDREEMRIVDEVGVRAYYFADAGSRAADEQHKAIQAYAGVRYTEKDDSGEWTEMAIGSDELADLMNDKSVKVWTYCAVFEEGE